MATINGTNGNDTLNGTGLNDTITGGNGNDFLSGLDGSDTLNGGNGNDTLLGGYGNDTLDGGNGNDTLDGGDGKDTLTGGNGVDILQGGAGNDTLDGGNEDDTIDGDAGNDAIVGGNGNDILRAGADNDTVSGGNGNDTLSGEGGNDTLDGGNDNDTLSGGSGNDSLVGGNGNDVLDGGTGNDTLSGGSNNDRLVYVRSENVGSTDVYDGGANTDTLRLVLTQAEYNAAVTQIQAFQALLASGGNATPFSFSPAFNLTAKNFEKLEVEIQGPANTAPTANNVSATGLEDANAIAITLTGTDPDAGDAINSFTLSSLPTNGTLYTNLALSNPAAINTAYTASGNALTLYFVPGANFNGSVSFAYTAFDGDASSDSATATINVTPVNDAPTAAAVSASGAEDAASIAITLTGADIDALDTVESFTVTVPPGNGTLYTDAAMLNPVGGSAIPVTGPNSLTLYFKPAPDFNGDVTFNYTASDGTTSSTPATATVHVTPVNDVPTDIALSNTSLLAGVPGATVGTLTVTDIDSATHTFTVSDPRFIVEGNTLRLDDGVSIDVVSGSEQVEIEVIATDAGGLSRSEIFTIDVASVMNGTALDGYIAGATVFADADGDGQFDPGDEVSTTTDANGNFTLVGGSGPLVMFGGTDIWTGLAFDGVMRAPEGSTVITPLTTLVSEIAGPGADAAAVAEANAQVLAALGLDSSLNLRSLDPIAAALSGDPALAEQGADALAAAIQLQNTIDQAAALLVGADPTAQLDASTAAAAVIAALASQVADGSVNLTDAGTITAILNEAATEPTVNVDIAATVGAATSIIAAGNQEAAAAEGLSGLALLTELAQIASVAQGEAATALASGSASTITEFEEDTVADDGSLSNDVVESAEIVEDELEGANGPDSLTGTGGHDVLNGYGGDDTINALAGNDVLIGGTGNDALLGGADHDSYRVGAFGGTGNDTITDISGNDTLSIFTFGPEMVASRSGNNLVITHGFGSDQVTIVDQFNGQPIEFVNLSGNNAVPAWVPLNTFAIASPGGAVSSPSFIVGTGGDDEITGGSQGDFLFGGLGNDELEGGNGDDVLYGGSGADILDGGAVDGFTWGVDFINYADSPDAITISLLNGTGIDGFGYTDTLISVEAVVGSAFNDVLTGSNNVGLFVQTERFLGGAGNDTIDGLGGFDYALYNGAPAAVTVNLGTTYTLGANTYTGFTGYDGYGGTDTFASTTTVLGPTTTILGSIEATRGGSHDDILIGSNRTDTTEQFRGGHGNDVIDGRLGNDMVDYINSGSGISIDLAGGLGFDGNGYADTLLNIENIRASMFDDVLIGNGANNSFQGIGGSDEIRGGAGFDTADYGLDSFTQGFGGITVDLTDTQAVTGGWAIDGSGKTDTLFSIENVLGTPVADTITGSADNNFLRGVGGNDVLDGAGGIDTIAYDFDASLAGGGGVSVSLTAGSAIDGFGNTDALSNFENVIGTNFKDTLVGDADVNVLTGNNGNDTLVGEGGNDTLIGGSGDDRYVVRRLGGNDVIVDSSGTDTLFLDVGTFTIADVRQSGNDLVIELIDGTTTTVAGHFSGSAIEVVEMANLPGFGFLTTFSILTGGVGSAANELIIGSNAGEVINGGTGSVGDGTNYIYAHAGDDTITGGGSDDFIEGGAGADTISGGLHSGLLAGGDYVTYVTSDAAVTVNLGSAGPQSGGHAEGDLLSGIEGVAGSAFGDTLTGRNNLNDRFNGNAGNDVIDGLSGFDQIEYADAAGGVTANLGTAYTADLGSGTQVYAGFTGHDGFGTTDTLTSLEGIRGSSLFDDVLIGSDRGDVTEYFRGRGGNDVIDGRGGFDEAGYITNSVPGAVDLDNDSLPVSVNLDSVAVMGIAPGLAISGTTTDTLKNIENIEASFANDVLIGSAANNSFKGLSGNDTIDGRDGSDTVNYSADAGTFGTLGVSVDLQAGFGIDGFGDTDTLVSIENAIGTNVVDTLIGDGAINIMQGFAGNDIIEGRGGDDLLQGGAGADTLIGGDGVDDRDMVQYIQSSSGVTVDLVSGVGIGGEAEGDTYQGIEGIQGSNFGDVLSGNSGSNFIRADGGVDFLFGREGDDLLGGGLGGDTLDGGDGTSDGAYYADAASAVIANLANPGANTGEAAGDTYISIETLVGSNFSDQLLGDAANNFLKGEAGGDFLFGAGGNDHLLGDSGDDRLDGGAGNDLIDGGESVSPGFHARFGDSDIADFQTSTAAVTIDFVAGTAVGTSSGTDTLLNVESVLGSDFHDVMIGADISEFSVATYFGAGGNDTITGGTTGFHQAHYGIVNASALPGAGVIVNLSSMQQTVGAVTLEAHTAIDNWGDTDTLANITSVAGSDNNDTLIGDDGDNRLRGRRGDDTLNGGDGIDQADYSQHGPGPATGATVDLSLNMALNDGRGFVDTLISIENLRGSELADILIGDGNDNRFLPIGGADTVDGGGGNDTISYFFEPGAVSVDLAAGTALDGFGSIDTLSSIENASGSAEGDTLRGDGNVNVINGDDGGDLIEGRAGNDTLTGAAGNDTFVFGAGFGDDVITDFVAGAGSEDRIDLSSLGTAFGNLTIQQNGSDTVVTGAAFAGNTITLQNVTALNVHQDDFIF